MQYRGNVQFYKEYSAKQEYFWGISAVASDEAAILPPTVAKLADTGEELEKTALVRFSPSLGA